MKRKRGVLKSIPANAALVAVSVVVTLFAFEAAVALFYPQKVYSTSAPGIFFIRHDPLLGWANKEGASGVYRPSPDIPATTVRINQFGFRCEAVPIEKPAGVKRIIFLGDSNTFGYGVEEEQRISDLLAKSLPNDYQVLNLGVFGYGTDQEALLLEREGMRFRPDLVVLGFSAGDLSENMFSINGGASKPFFRLVGDRLSLRNTPVPLSSPYMQSASLHSRVKKFLYRHSHLYRLVIARLIASNIYMPDSVAEMPVEEGMRTTVALIRRMNDLCRENGSRFVVLLIPHGIWLSAAKDSQGKEIGYYAALKGILDRSGIPFFDTTETLMREHEKKEAVFFEKDPVHLTPRGNGIIAGAFYQGLVAHGFIGR